MISSFLTSLLQKFYIEGLYNSDTNTHSISTISFRHQPTQFALHTVNFPADSANRYLPQSSTNNNKNFMKYEFINFLDIFLPYFSQFLYIFSEYLYKISGKILPVAFNKKFCGAARKLNLLHCYFYAIYNTLFLYQYIFLMLSLLCFAFLFLTAVYIQCFEISPLLFIISQNIQFDRCFTYNPSRRCRKRDCLIRQFRPN